MAFKLHTRKCHHNRLKHWSYKAYILFSFSMYHSAISYLLHWLYMYSSFRILRTTLYLLTCYIAIGFLGVIFATVSKTVGYHKMTFMAWRKWLQWLNARHRMIKVSLWQWRWARQEPHLLTWFIQIKYGYNDETVEYNCSSRFNGFTKSITLDLPWQISVFYWIIWR